MAWSVRTPSHEASTFRGPQLHLDPDLPGEDDPFRRRVRAWLDANPKPTHEQLANVGYVAPHWPAPFGLSASPVEQLVLDQELTRARVRRPQNAIAIGWAGPTILHAGTDEQQQRFLPPMLAGKEIWCQLFSEPDAGSDLASVATRAVKDGDEWVINGQKIWTTYGHAARWGILIARTDPDAPKQRGITYFICDMQAPGIVARPIVEMTGNTHFSEVFFTDVRIPDTLRVGAVNGGWPLAKVTLANERVSLSGAGVLWGGGPTADDLLALVRSQGGCADPVLRQRLARMFCNATVLSLLRSRAVAAQLEGRQPGAEVSVRKALGDAHGQEVMTLAMDLAGSRAMLRGAGPDGDADSVWHHGFLFSQALTIGGGTFAVQRNIIGERILGLPADVDIESGKTWAEMRR